jgi:ABC-type multidrug transport system fused ATPase/permease subunit
MDRLDEILDYHQTDTSFNIKDNIDAIVFDNVSFKYKDKNILDNFSIHISSGKYYGIIGENGSGKSTFIKLLLQLYKPDSGEILFKMNESTETSTVMSDTMNKIVYVEDKPCIFFDEIKKNIVFDCEKDEKIFQEALNKTGLDIYYNDLNSKNADELSAGQLQRLILTRGFYHLNNHNILILDEPFSALDSKIVRQLQTVLLDSKETKKLTILEITHNLTNLNRFDCILFFSDGKITMKGTHEELMKNYEFKKYVNSIKHLYN